MRVHVAPMEAMSGDLVARPVTRRNAQILTRFPVHEHSAAMWAAMWAAAVAAEFGVLVPVIFAHGAPHPGYDIAFRLLGGSFAACGLIAWHRRPDSRSGALMVAAAASGSSSRRCSSSSRPGSPRRSATYLSDLWTIPFIALLLTFLTGGRVQTTIDRTPRRRVRPPADRPAAVWLVFLDQDGNVLASSRTSGIASARRHGRSAPSTLAGCVAIVLVIAARWRARRRRGGARSCRASRGAVALALFAVPRRQRPRRPGARSELPALARDHVAGRSSRSRSSPASCARGSPAAASPTSFREPARDARRRRSRARSRARSATRSSSSPTASRRPRRLRRRAEGDAGHDADRPASTGGSSPSSTTGARSPRSSTTPRSTTTRSSSRPCPPPRRSRSRTSSCHAESEARLVELRASRERHRRRRRRRAPAARARPPRRRAAAARRARRCSCASCRRRIRDDPSTAEELATHARATSSPSRSHELRELARGIHPAVLDHGLAAALESLASRSPVPAALRYDADDAACPRRSSSPRYFVASEALTNVAKYAQATCAPRSA